MISKELFVEVVPYAKQLLSQDGYEFETFHFCDYDNTIRATISKITEYVGDYGTGIHCPVNINIYELAHKCKEWALNKCYELHTYIDFENQEYSFCEARGLHIKDINVFFDDIEYKAIFIACQWILDNE